MTLKNKRNFAAFLFVLISAVSVAQELPPPPMPTPPPGTPIDGGVLIGAFIALCYGVKKIIKKDN